jgi:hypothetical protein
VLRIFTTCGLLHRLLVCLKNVVELGPACSMQGLRNTLTHLNDKHRGKWPIGKPRGDGSIMLKNILRLLLVPE